MKITIPFNIFIFIWCLFGLAAFGYGYAQDLANGVDLFATRQFYSELCIPLACLYYCVRYLKDRFQKGSDTAMVPTES